MPSIDIDRALTKVEQKGEIFSAAIRLVIAVILFIAGWAAQAKGVVGHPLNMIGTLYGLIGIPGLFLAVKNFRNPWLSYVYVFVDVTAIASSLTMLANMHTVEMSHELALPIFTLTFVVLIHSALRYRPELIIFGAVCFTVQLFSLPFIFDTPFAEAFSEPVSNHVNFIGKMNIMLHDIGFLPIVFLLLSAVLLYYIVRRTRELMRLALVDERRAAQLSRFFSPTVARSLVGDQDGEIPKGHRQNVAVLFIDIRKFSRLSETISPEELADLLSSFRNIVSETIFEYGGTVDKFVGDAVLAVFGTPLSRKDDAKRAVDAVFQINKNINEWHCARTRVGVPTVTAGIGAHFGEVFAGVIESGQIMEHTIIGNAVNTAQRLERLTRDYQVDIVLSDELLHAAGLDGSELGLRARKDVSIIGRRKKCSVWYSTAQVTPALSH